jgi:hypothetical protein
MTAAATDKFRIASSVSDKPDEVTCKNADNRVRNLGHPSPPLQKGVAAITSVLDKVIPIYDMVYAVTEKAAVVTRLLVERGLCYKRVVRGLEQ